MKPATHIHPQGAVMSKIKDIDKKLEKELEKIKPEKELKIEIKEKPEKRELKEYKVETKERFKDVKDIKEKEKIEKIEQKEFREVEKRLFEGGGKDFVEVPDLPGQIFRAEKPEEGAGAAAPKPKEQPELKIQKEIEKIKPEKEFPDKLYKEKEIEKIKPEKEFPDKFQKEIEKIKPEKEFEKYQIEKIKPEKEFPEKFQVKPEFEKPSAETRLDPGTRIFKGTGSAEERLGELEDALERLTHFIGVDLRPDLTTGALKGEPDVAGGEAKSDDKKKPK